LAIITRGARADDETDVAALWQACGLVASYNDPGEDFRFALAGPASTVLLAVDDETGHLLGSVMAGHDGHRGWLYYVAAAPSAQGRGVGRLVVEAGEDWLRRHGIVKVQLLVRETNTKVVAFYEHLGFEIAPRIVMSKWLDGREA
jgi:ribosomal protein S18 acetylase RimI-like enzyme